MQSSFFFFFSNYSLECLLASFYTHTLAQGTHTHMRTHTYARMCTHTLAYMKEHSRIYKVRTCSYISPASLWTLQASSSVTHHSDRQESLLVETLCTAAWIDRPGFFLPSNHTARKPTLPTTIFLVENNVKGLCWHYTEEPPSWALSKSWAKVCAVIGEELLL